MNHLLNHSLNNILTHLLNHVLWPQTKTDPSGPEALNGEGGLGGEGGAVAPQLKPIKRRLHDHSLTIEQPVKSQWKTGDLPIFSFDFPNEFLSVFLMIS